jgi:hypothetical protein
MTLVGNKKESENFVHDFFDEFFHLIVVDATKLIPWNLTVRRNDFDIRIISCSGTGKRPCMQFLKECVSHTMKRD